MTTEALAITPSPVFRGEQMTQALADYRDLQKKLDESMPEQIMQLDGRPFRKKGYWRAIAVAFNLTVEPVAESRSIIGQLPDATDDYAYSVTYRATTSSGRSTIGDGLCAASEKQRGKMRATEHNVRSHAHTRAFNRAVSNLVGFGEVSAEEVGGVGDHDADPPKAADGSLLVKSVAVVHGGPPGGRGWTRYDVTFDSGERAATFTASVGQLAEQACENKRRVGALIEPGKRGLDLKELYYVEEEGPVGEALAAFDGEIEGREPRGE